MSDPDSSPSASSPDKTERMPPSSPHASPKPTDSHYTSELPLPEELQSMLGSAYIVESFLGQGGMGAVYRGLQMPLRRPVAIKILAKRQPGEEDEFAYEERFKREAYAMAALTHPHIVQVYDCGDAGELYLFISMELVEGGDLSDAIKSGLCTPGAALKWIPQICEGMQVAHERGLVHRDIKPANIFLTKDGRAKVADFGLAKKFDTKSTFVTKTGMGMGTPDYAAPEQYDAVPDLDHRADIYALGVMMYQMLTGRLPRGSGYKTPSQISGVDARIDAVVAKAMATERDERYQSAAQIAADLAIIMAPIPTRAIPVATPAATRTTLTTASPAPRAAVPTARPASPTPRRVAAPASSRPAESPPKAKSSAGSVVVILGVLAVLAIGAWIFFKKPPLPVSPSLSASPSLPVSASSPSSSPSPAFGPWQPLFTDAEWKETVPGKREFVDGRLHLQEMTFAKPRPFADGAIRARIQLREGELLHASLVARAASRTELYRLWTNGGNISLECFSPGIGPTDRMVLGRHIPPKPHQPGETLLLELRLKGDRLSALVDDAVVIEARDSRFTAPGEWGITASTGWFESVEIQSPLPAVAPTVGSAIGATKDSPFVNSLGMRFVPVPIIGGPTDGQRVLFSAWDTRVQDYEVFVKETSHSTMKAEFEQGPMHPAVMVSWDDARLFCRWLTEHERKAGKIGANEIYRLPSDHEWSCAAGIGGQEDPTMPVAEKSRKLKLYPWGIHGWPPPENAGNYAGEERTDGEAGFRDAYVNTSPVGSFPANAFGLYDMGGNVGQWCEDEAELENISGRVLRGSSWARVLSYRRVLSARFALPANHRKSTLGFRCVLAPTAP